MRPPGVICRLACAGDCHDIRTPYACEIGVFFYFFFAGRGGLAGYGVEMLDSSGGLLLCGVLFNSGP